MLCAVAQYMERNGSRRNGCARSVLFGRENDLMNADTDTTVAVKQESTLFGELLKDER